MGHSEMLLAVAGLQRDEIGARVRKLESGDWSDFPPAERAAFGISPPICPLPRHLSHVTSHIAHSIAPPFVFTD